MMSFAVSELTVMAQVGTTIGMGLLFDTLIRSFMTPVDRGPPRKRFWWPQVVSGNDLSQPWALAGIGIGPSPWFRAVPAQRRPVRPEVPNHADRHLRVNRSPSSLAGHLRDAGVNSRSSAAFRPPLVQRRQPIRSQTRCGQRGQLRRQLLSRPSG